MVAIVAVHTAENELSKVCCLKFAVLQAVAGDVHLGDLREVSRGLDGHDLETGMKSLQNFERLVLGCMDSYDSDQRLILQGFSRSTRFTNLCTAPNAKMQVNFVRHFRIFAVLFAKFQRFFAKFAPKSQF